MWCPSCHVAFDWNTLQIQDTRRIHNPEYFAFINKHNLQQGVEIRVPLQEGMLNPCEVTGTIPTRHVRFASANPELRIYTSDAIRGALHNLDTDRPVVRAMYGRGGRRNRDDITATFFEYGRDYLMGKIDLPKFRTLIQRAEKAHAKRTETTAIRLTWSESVLNIVALFVNTPSMHPSDLYDMLRENQKIADNALAKIGEIYMSSVPKLQA